MGIIPKPKVEQLQWCESHWPTWNDASASIGLTPTQTGSFKSLTQSARAAYDAAQNAKQAYRAAITAQNVALSAATSNAQDLIRVIKGFAELTSNPNNVYAFAQIPPPAVPVPILIKRLAPSRRDDIERFPGEILDPLFFELSPHVGGHPHDIPLP